MRWSSNHFVPFLLDRTTFTSFRSFRWSDLYMEGTSARIVRMRSKFSSVHPNAVVVGCRC
jgi:hypothetical protein